MTTHLVIFVRVDIPCKAKVGYFKHQIFADQAIPGRQISVRESEVRQIFHSPGNLDTQPPKIGLQNKIFVFMHGEKIPSNSADPSRNGMLISQWS